MILLLGGTTETPQIANLLAEKNCKVLISNLTESKVDWNLKSGIRIRRGNLDICTMCTLIANESITAIIDAGHPYAEKLHKTAIEAALESNIPYYRYERPGSDFSGYDVEFANCHNEAAEIAFKIGRNVLLTTGTRNLEPYVKIAQNTNSELYMRVLPCQESMDMCEKYAIDNNHIIAEQGPFTVKDNIEVIRKFSINILVTKNSGVAGGVPEKLESARECEIKAVVVNKPAIVQIAEKTFEDIAELIKEICSSVNETMAG
ncbi:MAG: precorrin-6A reductase [Planctomycetes bacterium]|nr:precorrin-6A reductase [Planctomycetota bacterium]